MITRYPSLADAALSVCPTAIVSFTGDDINTMQWSDLNTATQPTKEAIETEYTRMVDEYNSMEYSRLRKREYLQLNQFEMQYDDALNGTTTWQDAILAIKNKYPKPTGSEE